MIGSNAPPAGTSSRKPGSQWSALLICALCQALWSASSLAETASANASSRLAWSPTDMYEVGAIVNYAAVDYISLTKNVGMAPRSSSTDWAILAVTNVQREDPANDVRFSVGNWAVFSAENPRWTITATSTAAMAQPNGPKKLATPKSLQRPAEPTAAEPKHRMLFQAAIAFLNNSIPSINGDI
jgi:hypothetical protein